MENFGLVKIAGLNPMDLASICDHTFLDTVESYKYKIAGCDPIAKRREDFRAFLDKTINGPFKFAAVCVRGSDTAYARKFIDDSPKKQRITLAVTTGFPDGSTALNQKLYETRAALENGADEIDFVINSERLMHGDADYILNEMTSMSDLIASNKRKSKAILETAILDETAIRTACAIALSAGIDYVKTSTGYTGGATPDAVKLMRANFSRGVKASGGVTMTNIKDILYALSGRSEGMIELEPTKIRIGEGSLFKGICGY